MLMGIITYLGVVLVVRAGGQMPARAMGQLPLLTYIAIALGVLSVPLRMVIGSVVVSSGRKRIFQQATARVPGGDPTPDLTKVFLIRTIISAAMTEAPALVALTVYLVEGDSLALVAAVVLALLVATQFPTQSRLDDWLDAQRRRLEEDRLTQP
jgi:hypothetical protein